MPVSCECIRGLPLNDKLDAIYCAFYTAISNPVALPSCECVKGQPLLDKIDSIYCAILQFTQGGGGEIDPNNIQGATPYGISLLQLPAPQASALLSSDGATALVLDPTDSITQNIAFAQISDAGPFLTLVQNSSAPPPSQVAVIADASAIYFFDQDTFATFMTGDVPFTQDLNPPSSLSIVRSMVRTGS